jgi:hypothetical protein
MTDADRPRFAELFVALAETFNEALSEVRLEIYFRALSELTIAQLQAAIVDATRTLKFFPKPSELIALAQGHDSSDEDLAWMAVLRQVREVGSHRPPTFNDPAIMAAIEGAFTSWKRLCERLPLEGPNTSCSRSSSRRSTRFIASAQTTTASD